MAVGDHANLSELLSYLAALEMERGDLAAAAAAVAEAERTARDTKITANEVRARHTAGVLGMKSGASSAITKIVDALLEAEQLGAKTLVLDLVYFQCRSGIPASSDPDLRRLAVWAERVYQGAGNALRATMIQRQLP